MCFLIISPRSMYTITVFKLSCQLGVFVLMLPCHCKGLLLLTGQIPCAPTLQSTYSWLGDQTVILYPSAYHGFMVVFKKQNPACPWKQWFVCICCFSSLVLSALMLLFFLPQYDGSEKQFATRTCYVCYCVLSWINCKGGSRRWMQ